VAVSLFANCEFTGQMQSFKSMRSMLILLVLFGAGCQQQPALPPGSIKTLDDAGSRLAQLSGQKLRPYATRDFGREQNPDGRSVVVSELRAPQLVQQLKGELGPGLVVYMGHTQLLPPDQGSEVVVAPGESQFDILRMAESDAANYGLDTEGLVKKLQDYDGKYGIEIFHADTDTIEFTLKSMPADMPAFCRDLYKFCPDTVEQGVGSLLALQAEIAKTRQVYLWWD
jgi:hypothetical protein